MEKKTICFINTNKAWGGGEKWHLDMATRLMQRGHQVNVLARTGGPLERKCKAAEIPVRGMNYGNLSFLNPLTVVRITTLIKELAPRVVILNLPADLKTAGLAAKRAGVPTIIYRRGTALPVNPHLLNRYLFRKVLTGVIANSKETKKLINHKAPLIPQEKIHVIYNGVTPHHYRPEEKKNNTLIIGNAGRMVRQKGQTLLTDLALQLTARDIDFQIHIAGDGPLLKELTRAVKAQHLSEKVIFKGFQKDLHAFYSKIHLFVLPSYWEGFGYVMAEAMLYHTPVIAFNHSSNPEVVTDGETGYLIPSGRIDIMADKIAFLGKNREKRLEMGRKAGHDARTRFSMEWATTQLEQLLTLSS